MTTLGQLSNGKCEQDKPTTTKFVPVTNQGQLV